MSSAARQESGESAARPYNAKEVMTPALPLLLIVVAGLSISAQTDPAQAVGCGASCRTRTRRHRRAAVVRICHRRRSRYTLRLDGGRWQDVTMAVVLERLHQYLRDYAELLPATIAINATTSGLARERVELESEFGIVRVPNNPQWLGFRDVMKVNVTAVESRDQRLVSLFENLTVNAIEQAGRISAASARFNIGPLRRSINDPALVLELLDWRNAHRMRVQKIREVTSNGIPVWIVRFQETGRPTIVRTSSLGNVPSSGQAWIDPSTVDYSGCRRQSERSVASDVRSTSPSRMCLSWTFSRRPE